MLCGYGDPPGRTSTACRLGFFGCTGGCRAASKLACRPVMHHRAQVYILLQEVIRMQGPQTRQFYERCLMQTLPITAEDLCLDEN